MKQFTYSLCGYQITSYGNGTAYAVKCPETGRSFYMQGDDASQLSEEMESNPGYYLPEYMAALGQTDAERA